MKHHQLGSRWCMAESSKFDTTATQLLREQHQNVKQMFSQLAAAEGAQRGELFDCLRATLAVHETAEGMIVYPALHNIGDEASRIADQRIEEETEAKRVLSDLEKTGVDGTGFESQFEQFRTSVLQHAEAEESQVFPLLDSNVDSQKLHQMASAIQAAEKL